MRDPLCYLLDHGPGPCDLCRILAQARLQGPIRHSRHPVTCWCESCFPRPIGQS